MHRDVERKLQAIRRDQEHGAAFLAREALATLKLAAERGEAEDACSFLREMAKLGTRLISLRPSMSAPIANGIVRAFDAVSERTRGIGSVAELRKVAFDVVDELLKVAERNALDVAAHVARAIPDGAAVMTHSYSETCLRALLGCGERGVRVFATESRPLYEGRSMAASLQRAGIEVTLITDAGAGHFVSDVQAVLVGADTILPDGSVLNKMGTCLIALAAREAGVPFLVAADTWKFRIEPGTPELEEKSPDEVVDNQWGIAARNVYFDLTPARLVSSLITEKGPMKPEQIGAQCGRWREVLEEMGELAR